MMRLTAEVARQVETLKENLRRSRELLDRLGKNATVSGPPPDQVH